MDYNNGHWFFIDYKLDNNGFPVVFFDLENFL